QALQHSPFDGVGCHEVEDETVFGLPVAVNPAHALLQAVGVPRNVVVEHDVADLEVDTLTGRLRGHQDLDGALTEQLLGVQPGTRVVPTAWLHAAMDGAHPESP